MTADAARVIALREGSIPIVLSVDAGLIAVDTFKFDKRGGGRITHSETQHAAPVPFVKLKNRFEADGHRRRFGGILSENQPRGRSAPSLCGPSHSELWRLNRLLGLSAMQGRRPEGPAVTSSSSDQMILATGIAVVSHAGTRSCSSPAAGWSRATSTSASR